jgi:radical SAM protein with 4Fe4S-binding SPASM domain
VSTETTVRALSGTAARLNIPINAVLELTYRCNMSCFHCYVVPEDRPEMSTDEVVEVLEQLARAGSLFVTFTGGEILLREDLEEILTAARRLRFAVRLFTNGTLIDEEAADLIASIHPFDVGVSIYGADAEAHEFVTGAPGSFERSVEGLRLLHARGVATRLKCVLMRHNANDIERIAALAGSVGATPQYDPQLTPRNDGHASALAERVDEDTLARILFEEPRAGDARAEYAPCAAGRETLCISPSGVLRPCVQMPYPLGDIRAMSLRDAWNSEEAARVRAIRLTSLEGCGSCADAGWCDPCLGLNLIETGSLTAPSASVCRVTRAKRKGARS